MILFSLRPESLGAHPISQSILQMIRLPGEFNGHQELFREKPPQVLDPLRQPSPTESTEPTREKNVIIESLY